MPTSKKSTRKAPAKPDPALSKALNAIAEADFGKTEDKSKVALPDYAKELSSLAVRGDLILLINLSNSVAQTAAVLATASKVYAGSANGKAFQEASDLLVAAIKKVAEGANTIFNDVAARNGGDMNWMMREAVPPAPSTAPAPKKDPYIDPSII